MTRFSGFGGFGCKFAENMRISIVNFEGLKSLKVLLVHLTPLCYIKAYKYGLMTSTQQCNKNLQTRTQTTCLVTYYTRHESTEIP